MYSSARGKWSSEILKSVFGKIGIYTHSAYQNVTYSIYIRTKFNAIYFNTNILLISDPKMNFYTREGVTEEKEQSSKLLSKPELASAFESGYNRNKNLMFPKN